MSETYGVDIFDRAYDSLEGVMGQIYTDIFNPNLEEDARQAFQSLLLLFVRRLALTTNNMPATNKRMFYRILVSYLSEGLQPKNLTVITFNQDLQVEKMLMLLRETTRWQAISNDLLSFPGCYMLESAPVTFPEGGGVPVFPRDTPNANCIRLLKLHGSLNWYSTHNSPTPPPNALFRPTRTLRITCRQTIDTGMMYTGGERRTYAVPVVVPPVSHKSAVLHEGVRAIWGLAEERLTSADEIVVFGYSCPPLDFESLNLLRRSGIAGDQQRKVAVIDPDASVLTRYAEALCPHRLYYYPDAHDFLADF
jgi:hypothetical protein